MAGQLVGELVGGAVAQLLQVELRPADRGRLAFQDRGQRVGQGGPVAAADTSPPGQVTLGPAQPVSGLRQRQEPVQRGDRSPRPQAAQVGPEVPDLAAESQLTASIRATRATIGAR